jgi:hypothetical protein
MQLLEQSFETFLPSLQIQLKFISFKILCLGGHHDQWFTLDNQVHFTLNPMSKIKISYEYVHNLTSNHNIKQCN